MRIVGFDEMRNASLAHKEGSPHIDVMHEIPTLPFCLVSRCECNCTRIIDQDINISESIDSGVDQLLNTFFKPDICLHWKYLAGTLLCYFFCSCINSSL